MTGIVSVWSSFDHTFISEDGHESCLTCGALYELTAREGDPSSGDYVAADGSDPMPCTGDTSMAHGYPGERVCDCDDGCEHCAHDCNCLRCA